MPAEPTEKPCLQTSTDLLDPQGKPSESDAAAQPNSTWAQLAIDAQASGGCQAIGFVSASREPIDLRTSNDLARTLAGAAHEAIDARMLLLRLNVFEHSSLDRLDTQTKGIPASIRSPLGQWQEVSVPVPVGVAASWSLIQLPKWLAKWRTQYGLILVDIGRIDLAPARVVGRLCQATYVVAGPQPSGSPDWVATHIHWMRSAGAQVNGSIIAEPAGVAPISRAA